MTVEDQLPAGFRMAGSGWHRRFAGEVRHGTFQRQGRNTYTGGTFANAGDFRVTAPGATDRRPVLVNEGRLLVKIMLEQSQSRGWRGSVPV